jgi:hypothetical protein
MKDTKKKSGLKERMADVFFEIKEPKDETKVDSSQTGTGSDPKSQKAG